MQKKLQAESGIMTNNANIGFFSQYEEPKKITLVEYFNDIWLINNQMALSMVESIDFGRKLTELSGGEWMKARLARLLNQRFNYLI